MNPYCTKRELKHYRYKHYRYYKMSKQVVKSCVIWKSKKKSKGKIKSNKFSLMVLLDLLPPLCFLQLSLDTACNLLLDSKLV